MYSSDGASWNEERLWWYINKIAYDLKYGSKIVLIRALLSLSSSQPSCDIMLVTLLVCR